MLCRRQVIKSSHSRLATDYLTQDAHDHLALDYILKDLEPLFTWMEKPVLYGKPDWIKETSGVSGDSNTGSVGTF